MTDYHWMVYAIVNGLVFFLYGVDKLKAEGGKYRVPEKKLILAALAGPIGGGLGMMLFRHKIRKMKFKVAVPGFFLLHIILLYLILYQL